MRIWHWKLLPYLPDRQFKGQLRELVAIMHDWRDKGRTNHLLINRVMESPRLIFLNIIEFMVGNITIVIGNIPRNLSLMSFMSLVRLTITV